jgi:hypothetical protein
MGYKIQSINVEELTEENLFKYTKGGWEIINVFPKYETVDNKKSVLANYSLLLRK